MPPLGIGSILQPQQLVAQREAVRLVLRVVEAHLAFEHHEVVAHLGQPVRQAVRPGDRHVLPVGAAPRRAEGPLPHDLAQELGARCIVGARQVGLVVVGGGGEVGILLGQVELLAILLQGVVLEDAVGHVAVALRGDLSGPPLAREDQLVQLAKALLQGGVVFGLGGGEFVRGQEQLEPQHPLLFKQALQLASHLPQLRVGGMGEKVQLGCHLVRFLR